MRPIFRILAFASAIAVVLTSSATGSPPSVNAAAPIDEPQPSLVENYEHPGAEKILQERGIQLKNGDGGIMFVDCTPNSGLVEIESTAFPAPRNLFCFKLSGDKGYLSMELPQAYVAKSNSYNVVATWRTESGEIRNTQLAKNTFTAIGEGTGAGPGPLLELKSTR
jgi:hypothetical protein